jgi:hypothetical protein
MPVNSTHPCYDEFIDTWLRNRDVLAGEQAIKKAGQKYIPKLTDQQESEYLAYVNRGFFYNATARSVEGYLGMIFRKSPTYQLGPKSKAFTASLSQVQNDVDLAGTSLESYAKNVVKEVLSVGRGGSIVDWNDGQEKRAYLCFYRAEDILNWRMSRIGGESVLTMVTLQETRYVDDPEDDFVPKEKKTIRVLRLVPFGNTFQYQVQLWEEVESKNESKTKGGKGYNKTAEPEWKLTKSMIPMRRGKSLVRIPFVFHGPSYGTADIEKSPIEDIVAVNLDHFRLSTDYRHGMHFTALPTAWVAGFDKKTELRIGSATAWVTDTVGAAAGFLEFKGQGLMTFERALDRCERLLAVLGSRLLEAHKRVSESAEALSIRQAGESSIIQSIAFSISSSLDELLNWVYWWHSTEASPDDVTPEHAIFKLNSDFESNQMAASELLALVYSWQSGAISRETLHHNLKQGEVLPPGRSSEEEARLILANPAPPPPVALPKLNAA